MWNIDPASPWTWPGLKPSIFLHPFVHPCATCNFLPYKQVGYINKCAGRTTLPRHNLPVRNNTDGRQALGWAWPTWTWLVIIVIGYFSSSLKACISSIQRLSEWISCLAWYQQTLLCIFAFRRAFSTWTTKRVNGSFHCQTPFPAAIGRVTLSKRPAWSDKRIGFHLFI